MSSRKKIITFEITCRKCVKPSLPTPPHLGTFKLSLLDQLSPDIHGNMTLFYPYNSDDDDHDLASRFSTNSQLLQNSLSETLARFYPFVGRLQDAATVHCNDDGAIFIEARTDASVSDILADPDFDTLEHFLPTADKETTEMSNGSMLLVRFTSFACGGTAVTISLTHKIADITSLIALLRSWTSACRGGVGSCTGPSVIPEPAVGSVLFPPRENIPGGMSGSVTVAAEKFTIRRFVFRASKVAELRSRVITALAPKIQNQKDEEDAVLTFYPSRVEVVLALLWKSAMLCSKTASFKPSALFQAVNLRPRMDPPVPDTAVGNFVWPFAVTVEEESDLELQKLVGKMRKAMREFLDKRLSKFKEEGAFGVVMETMKERVELLKKNKDIVVYKCTSWCKFPLLEANFGWGNPVWMSSVNKLMNNTIALMDTRDGGGVEAFVTLGVEEMGLFEQHQELLHYAQLNPAVIF